MTAMPTPSHARRKLRRVAEVHRRNDHGSTGHIHKGWAGLRAGMEPKQG